MCSLNYIKPMPLFSNDLDLDLVPPVPSGTLGDELSPSGTIAGSISRVTPVPHPLSPNLLLAYPCHVLTGLPAFLLPPSGIHSTARLAGLVAVGCRMCSTNRLLLVATMSCSANCPDRAITSFVMWSCHEMPKMLLRHRRWKTSIILVILLFVFHVSLA